jgi:AcrR family transcriptional regulator
VIDWDGARRPPRPASGERGLDTDRKDQYGQFVQTTETSVVDAARRCFARYGYRKTSMDDVAGDAGVAKGTVYLYCANKQDLYVRAIESDVRAWMASLASTFDDPDRPALEILIEMATRDALFVESHPLAAALLTGATDDHVPNHRDRLDGLRRLGLAQVIAVLELGVAQGVFRAELDIEPTARVLQEMHMAGAVLRHDTHLTLDEVRRRQRAALDLVLRGLEVRDPA